MKRVCLFVLCLLSAYPALNWSTPVFESVTLTLQGREYHLQVARSSKQKSHGLMFREQLAPDQGMLFVYHRAGDYRIWMKNTLIPLTVIWLDDDTEVVEIRLLQPCRQVSCPSYGAGSPARYILELHADEYHRFQVGDRLPMVRNWQDAMVR